MIKVAPEAPAVAVTGRMDAMVGAGGDEAEIVNGDRFERTPEFETAMFTVVAEPNREGGTLAVSCVELTKVVASAEGGMVGDVTQLTTEPFTKFAPVTVKVTGEELHDGVELDEVVEADKPVTEGARITNIWLAGHGEGGAAGVMLNAVMQAVWFELPVICKSAAGTVATSSAGFPGDVAVADVAGTYVVARLETTLFGLTHWTTLHGRRFEPWSVMAKGGPPAGPDAGETELMLVVPKLVAGVERVNGKELEVPTELATVIVALPGKAASAGETENVSCVALTKVVV